MVRRICPICDQIMKSAHYCRNCKSFVRNPYIRETDYYLNERHPASEEHCSFHDPWEEEKGQKPAKAAMPNCVYPPDTPSLWQWEEVTGREA